MTGQALVLIDFQRDFGAPDGAMAGQGHDITAALAAAENAQVLAAAARATDRPVIFVRLVMADGDLCVEGTAGAEFFGPQPRPDETIISKSLYNAFANTGLEEQLLAQDIKTLVVAGLTTECCVAATVWDAFERDFTIVIAADACAAYEEELHRVTLKSLGLSGAEVSATSDIVSAWKKAK